MIYRDFMQKYRPLYAPDGVDGAAVAGDSAAAAAVGAAAPGSEAAPAQAAEASDVAAAAAAPAVAAEAPAAGSEAAAPSLLEAAAAKKPDAGETGKTDSPAPAETAKPEGEKPEGDKDPKAEAPKDPKDAAKADPESKAATAEAQPPAPLKYDAFKLPDGVTLDDERLGKFSEVAGAGQVTQEVAQNLLNLHLEEMQRYASEVQRQAADHQRDVWNKLNDSWKSELRKDERLGGNRLETNLSMSKAVIEEYGGSPQQVAELIAHTSNNGMGNFPGFVRLLVNLGEALNVFEESSVGGDTRPAKPGKGPGNRGWYTTMGNGQG